MRALRRGGKNPRLHESPVLTMHMTLVRSQKGFSLIELMIALVAGLIVVGAVLAFTLSSLNSNTEYVTATRLTQELRNNLSLVTDDLRRAGYDENAMSYLARPASFTDFSKFSRIQISGDCIIYAYDRAGGTAGQLDLDNGEVHAVRRATRTVNGVIVGVIESAESSSGNMPSCTGNGPDYTTYPATCNGTSGWCALSDPRVLDIQTFQVVNDLPVTGGAPGYIAGSGNVLPMQERRIRVAITGSLVGVPTVVRGARSYVRVRTDCVRSGAATNCTAAPNGA
jgi:prepilin-type N-terminal cleavage/methylation domain-containing protein